MSCFVSLDDKLVCSLIELSCTPVTVLLVCNIEPVELVQLPYQCTLFDQLAMMDWGYSKVALIFAAKMIVIKVGLN